MQAPTRIPSAVAQSEYNSGVLSDRPPRLIVALRDGTPVRVRLVRPDDRGLVLRGVGEMSGTSRYMRFFAGTPGITDRQARYFTDIDQVNHVAVCGVEPTDAEDRGYGIARFVRDADDPHAAEFAVAVIDAMQRRGLGTVLLAALHVLARARGVRELRGEILSENPVMLEWLPRLGATLDAIHDPAYRLSRWTVRPAGAPPVPGIAPDFALWLERLRPTFGG